MKKTLLKLASAAVLLACTAAPSIAASIQTPYFELGYDENSFAAVSYTANSVTFTSKFYFSSYGSDQAVIRDLFVAGPRAGVQFTGGVSVKTEVEYQLGAYPYGSGDFAGSVVSTIDVLAPRCDRCGIYESDLLSSDQIFAGATSATPTSGVATGALQLAAPSAKTYDHLAIYAINDYGLNETSGMLHLREFTVTFDTAGQPLASPVPELPPFALIGAGLLALGLRERVRKALRRNA